jgi:adenosylcobyric acid synthase
MKRRTGRPVYGVVPHIERLGLPEEDSVGFKSGGYDLGPPQGEHVEIALIDLPHISNFTDIDPFLAEPDVYLKIVRRAGDLGRPDAVIIPGSKNTMGDVAFLQRDGLGERIRDLAAAGETEVVGLCAGFQILGERIDDPHGLESTSRESVPGLGLLRVTNVLEREKTLKRVEAEHVPSGLRVQGYEIHHGQLGAEGDGRADVTGSDGRVIGLSGDRGRVWGTYLHGIFDDDLFRRWFIDSLRRRRGLAPVGRVVAAYDLDAALDRLAGIVRESLDIEALYRLMGLK